jgi:hypothetical protein
LRPPRDGDCEKAEAPARSPVATCRLSPNLLARSVLRAGLAGTESGPKRPESAQRSNAGRPVGRAEFSPWSG